MTPLENVIHDYWHVIAALIAVALAFARAEALAKRTAGEVDDLLAMIKEVKAVQEKEKERVDRRMSDERKEMQKGFDRIDQKLDTLSGQLVAQLLAAIKTISH